MRFWSPGDPIPADERPRFVDHQGEQLSVVQHLAPGVPKAAVVLAGPMTLERSHSALTWVRWARTLALNGYDVWRFDYRGVGESTGDFKAQTFAHWQADLAAVTGLAASRSAAKVAVVGLRLGALLGRVAFDAHEVDAFIAWDAPVSGKTMLMDMLRRKLAADYMEHTGGEKKTRDDYVRELENGAVVEVEGYHWSKALWQSTAAYTFTEPEKLSGQWLSVSLDARTPPAAPFGASAKIPRPVFWLQSAHLVADLKDLFTLTIDRLDSWFTQEAGQAEQRRSREVEPATPPTEAPLRTLDVLDLPAGRCVGTLHHPNGTRSKTGLLWVNFGYVPRDGHGGLAAHASDSMARRGVPCFRYDLPGLGDAPGPLPATTHQFFPVVTSGQLTDVTTQLVQRLCEREQLDGLVVAGLCGGAVNAIFTADAQKERVRGLVLLEPEMYVTEPKKDDDEGAAPRRKTRDWVRSKLPESKVIDLLLSRELPYEQQLEKLGSKVFSYWGWMRLLTLENRYGRYVPLPRKQILDFVLSRSALPAVTNLPLASAWARWVGEKRPALIITADAKLREVFFDRINRTVLAGIDRQNYVHVRVPGTNHIFTTGGAIATVTSLLERHWPLFTGTPSSS